MLGGRARLPGERRPATGTRLIGRRHDLLFVPENGSLPASVERIRRAPSGVALCRSCWGRGKPLAVRRSRIAPCTATLRASKVYGVMAATKRSPTCNLDRPRVGPGSTARVGRKTNGEQPKRHLAPSANAQRGAWLRKATLTDAARFSSHCGLETRDAAGLEHGALPLAPRLRRSPAQGPARRRSIEKQLLRNKSCATTTSKHMLCKRRTMRAEGGVT